MPPGGTGGELQLVPLSQIDVRSIVDLMNHKAVGERLPLLKQPFSAADCRAFLTAKQALWDPHSFGPLGIKIGGVFAGWGGFQPEGDDADFALVLHPDFWGWGRRIFHRFRQDAFGRMGLSSITILLPPGRARPAALTRVGFVADGAVSVGETRFLRYRLRRPEAP